MNTRQSRLRLLLPLSLTLAGLTIGTASAADVAKLVESCAGCHGSDGASTESDIPIIGGYSATYLTDSLINYQNQDRPCPEVEFRAGDRKGEKSDMCKVAKELTEEDIKQIAKYFAAKPFVRAKQAFDAALAKQGQEIHESHCTKCHEDGGSSPDDDAGILAGQWMPYIKHTFDEFTSGERPMPKKMKPKMEKLSKEDLVAITHYFGSFQ